MPTDTELYRDLMHVSHLLRHGHGEKALQINPGQQRVLMALGRDGSVAQRDLLRELGTSPASLSELLSKMEEDKLVKRERSANDRRVLVVTLTAKGAKQARALADAQNAVAQEVFSALGDGQRAQLAGALRAILDARE